MNRLTTHPVTSDIIYQALIDRESFTGDHNTKQDPVIGFLCERWFAKHHPMYEYIGHLKGGIDFQSEGVTVDVKGASYKYHLTDVNRHHWRVIDRQIKYNVHWYYFIRVFTNGSDDTSNPDESWQFEIGGWYPKELFVSTAKFNNAGEINGFDTDGVWSIDQRSVYNYNQFNIIKP